MAERVDGVGRRIGRYILYDSFATGGMASVHLARAVGTGGFARTVAIKRLHPHFARDAEFVAMLVDEGQLSSRIHHPAVVATLDVISDDGELLLVMEYVAGESLSKLLRAARQLNEPVPIPIAAAILVNALYGLHAAHKAADADGTSLRIVHRDVSPQNILVGIDGTARVLDFGVAKAAARSQTTRDGNLKGKVSYMSPEQLRRQPVDRRADVYAAGVVGWEILAGRLRFAGEGLAEIALEVLEGLVVAPSAYRSDVPQLLEDAIMHALFRDPEDRFPTAEEFARAVEASTALATPREVGAWVSRLAADALAHRAARVASIETSSRDAGAGSIRPSEQPTAKATLAADSPTAASGTSAARKLGVGIILVASLATGVLALVRATPPSSTSAGQAADASSPHAQDPALADPAVTADDPEKASAMQEQTAPPEPVGSLATESSNRGRRATAPHRAPSPRPTARKLEPNADCAELYAVDDAGIKRFKSQCLSTH